MSEYIKQPTGAEYQPYYYHVAEIPQPVSTRPEWARKLSPDMPVSFLLLLNGLTIIYYVILVWFVIKIFIALKKL